ncbi:hypothetical protein B0H16DRAFT_1728305 [Mycena metata]|uniref:Uncharacterized protein n=1 Tax=Mycena metata TaxID=1033252 RepID=A0AAD7IH34_9AGAR|nr:hypothetical protein B0H16DRAFT_1728305 [Mycena metata]
MMPPYTDAIQPRRLAHSQYSWWRDLGTKRTTSDPAARHVCLRRIRHSPVVFIHHPYAFHLPPCPQLLLPPSHPFSTSSTSTAQPQNPGKQKNPRMDGSPPPPSCAAAARAALVAEKISEMICYFWFTPSVPSARRTGISPAGSSLQVVWMAMYR